MIFSFDLAHIVSQIVSGLILSVVVHTAIYLRVLVKRFGALPTRMNRAETKLGDHEERLITLEEILPGR